MPAPGPILHDAASRLDEVWLRALPPFGVVDGPVAELVGQMDDAGLLALLDTVTELARHVDALTAAVAGEIAERSPVGSRRDGLAHREGFGSPARLVAASTGGTVGRAAVMATVGQATAPRRALTGEVLPAAHPQVAAVLHAGAITLEAAHLIIAMLDRVAPRVAPDVVEKAEKTLARKAVRFSLADLTELVKRMESHLDPDGVEPREEVLRQSRSLVVREDKSGRLLLRGTFDPDNGAPIKAALDAYVANALRTSRGHHHPADSVDSAGGDNVGDDPGTGTVVPETRSIAQIRADGLADFARHVLSCEDRVPGLPATTVMVRIDLEDLQHRAGGREYATIDGIDQPISPATARRMACTAGLLPAVFGGSPVPLDLGRERRLFSRAQTIALWERDGGCASCGQRLFVETHHCATWEDGGPTNLSNGVLLCSRCHHKVHRDHWQIHIKTDRVWFIPPPIIDPARRPRPGVTRQTPRDLTGHDPDDFDLTS